MHPKGSRKRSQRRGHRAKAVTLHSLLNRQSPNEALVAKSNEKQILEQDSWGVHKIHVLKHRCLTEQCCLQDTTQPENQVELSESSAVPPTFQACLPFVGHLGGCLEATDIDPKSRAALSQQISNWQLSGTIPS